MVDHTHMHVFELLSPKVDGEHIHWKVKEAISPVSAQAPHNPSAFAQNFGGNEWLIDEQYEKYLANPDSVGPEWREFFAKNKPQTRTEAASTATTNSAAPASTQTTPSAPASTETGTDRDVPEVPEATDPVAVAPTAPYATTPEAGAPRSAGGDDEVERLRGPAARVVTNMETSLEVPTATSVRTMPAKLIIDNRIVLNNHLKRAR
ncbi:MAG TPA: hypothetical protein VK054_10440, partial [Beutenbergiaceae bacterium]|nr:hypothetical protein [Beutenbergiaceae bacterium]